MRGLLKCCKWILTESASSGALFIALLIVLYYTYAKYHNFEYFIAVVVMLHKYPYAFVFEVKIRQCCIPQPPHKSYNLHKNSLMNFYLLR